MKKTQADEPFPSARPLRALILEQTPPGVSERRRPFNPRRFCVLMPVATMRLHVGLALTHCLPARVGSASRRLTVRLESREDHRAWC